MNSLLSWREEFPILGSSAYLISNSLGAMPRGASERMNEYCTRWAQDGVRAWHDWWGIPETVGDMIAPLIGAPGGSVSMHLNVTSAQAAIASCFQFSGKRSKVVYSAMNFPSVTYFYCAQQEIGARIHTVPSLDGISVNLGMLLDAIDEETLLVPISHVLFRSSFIQDAKAIAEKCRKVGAHLVLDVYQSAGVVPINLSDWDIDFAVGGTLKWLCGGPGAAFLYVNPQIANTLTPRLTGWIADTRPFDFVVNDHEYTSGPYRFMNGTPNIPGLYAAIAGLEIIGKVGVEAIRTNSMRQTAMMLDIANEKGWKTTTPTCAESRGATVAFNLDNGFEIAQELIKRRVMVDYRPKSGIRVSPHFYNSDEDILRFFSETEDILRTDAHLAHVGTKRIVT